MQPQQLRKKARRPISSRIPDCTSTRSTSYLKTRIRGARLVNAARLLVLIELTHRLHQAYAQAYDKQASDQLLPQDPAPQGPAPGQTLSQADCDKKIAGIFGGPGAVAATVNEPNTLQHPSAGQNRYNHLAGNGVFHLYSNAQGTEATVGLYALGGFIGTPATGTVYNGPNDPTPARLTTITRDSLIGAGFKSPSYMLVILA